MAIEWSKTNSILQVIGNAGILVGLFLVGLEIRETNRIAEAQFASEDYAAAMSSFEAKMGEDFATIWRRAAINADDLTEEEMVSINAFLTREWYRYGQEAILSQFGFSEVDLDLGATEWVYNILGNETAHRWWTRHQNGMLSLRAELRDAINVRLAETGSDHTTYDKRMVRILLDGPLHPTLVQER